jgi:hypothetical protein
MWKKKTGSSSRPTDNSPAAPWDFDIFKRKIICFSAKNIAHYTMFAALNAGLLIHGRTMKKQKCGLASFDSLGMRKLPLPKDARFVEYVYFLLNICHAIHLWVLEQDEANTESVDLPEFESIFDACQEAAKSERRGGSSIVALCIPKLFQLPNTRAMDTTAVSIHVSLGLCLWQSNVTTQNFGWKSILLAT